MEQIINKVEQSGLVQFDLESLYQKGERILFDLKEWLYEGLILREKDFREKIKSHDWPAYQNKFVAVACTADAIVPTWAFMLVSASLEPYAAKVVFGDLKTLEEQLFAEAIAKLDPAAFRDSKVVIKGCSDNVPVSAYVSLTAFLRPLVKSVMYGEPCSTVPVYKSKS